MHSRVARALAEEKNANAAELRSGTLRISESHPMYFTWTARTSLENAEISRIVPECSSLRFFKIGASARWETRAVCARWHITWRNIDARTYYSLACRRYGGANCNLCLIAVVVGAPRQRELRRRQPFLRFKAFQEGNRATIVRGRKRHGLPRFLSMSPANCDLRRAASPHG